MAVSEYLILEDLFASAVCRVQFAVRFMPCTQYTQVDRASVEVS